jgi:hypothetical protein
VGSIGGVWMAGSVGAVTGGSVGLAGSPGVVKPVQAASVSTAATVSTAASGISLFTPVMLARLPASRTRTMLTR